MGTSAGISNASVMVFDELPYYLLLQLPLLPQALELLVLQLPCSFPGQTCRCCFSRHGNILMRLTQHAFRVLEEGDVLLLP